MIHYHLRNARLFSWTLLILKSNVVYLKGLLFLLYINDPRYSLKYSTVSHFADDTSIIYSSNHLKAIETNLNFDLKCVSEWLKSNRLSLNVKKTKLLFFRFKYKTLQENISIKIQGVRINHMSNT